jgi:hemerythrin-like metal-binding protein
MAKIKWTEDFSVKNKDIDDQHKKWIQIYNKAHDRMMSRNPVGEKIDIGGDALSEMIEYGKYHFAFEEKFMEKIKFSKIEEHKKIHKFFVQKLDGIAVQIKQGTLILNSEIIKIIENWLVEHILTEDKKYIQ